MVPTHLAQSSRSPVSVSTNPSLFPRDSLPLVNPLPVLPIQAAGSVERFREVLAAMKAEIEKAGYDRVDVALCDSCPRRERTGVLPDRHRGFEPVAKAAGESGRELVQGTLQKNQNIPGKSKPSSSAAVVLRVSESSPAPRLLPTASS